MRFYQTIKAGLNSRLFFCLSVAFLMVAARLLIFDYATFFQLRYIPNHDMYQGASYFMTSMHSLRLQGDLAWWNPIALNGYAQYYQAFIGPLAPTPGHITFIVWAEGIRVLDAMGVAVPEYFQYLVFNYMLLPFLTFLVLAYLLSLLFQRRATVLLVVITYTFSTLGLWTSAWFYFQESFTVFFLLAAFIHYLKRPTLRLLMGLLIAGLIQLASFNYWTVYNSWFLLFVVGGYLVTYPNQAKRAWWHALTIIKTHPIGAGLLGGLVLITTLVWLALIASITAEQSKNYYRAGEDGDLSVAPAIEGFKNAPPIELRNLNLFNPDIHTSTTPPYNFWPTMHSAGYIGLFMLPLLALLPFYRWRRLERWLVWLVLGSLLITMATPLFLWAWDTVPFMDHIRHFVRFYGSYTRLGLILLGGASFDYLLRAELKKAEQQRFRIILAVLCGVGLVGVLAGGLALTDTTVQTIGFMGMLLLIASVLLLQITHNPQHGQRSVMVGLLLIFAFGDMSRYFAAVERYDSDFTATRWSKVERPLPEAVKSVLRNPMPIPPPGEDFQVVAGYIPVSNDFWPQNTYIYHHDFDGLSTDTIRNNLTYRESLVQFYTPDQIRFVPDQKAGLALTENDLPNSVNILVVEGDPIQPNYAATPSNLPTAFTYQRTIWQYNNFNFEVEIPQDGWLSIGQISDPAWHVTIDGKRVDAWKANFVRQAFPIGAGHHTVVLDFQPLSRRLYWPASYLLEFTVLVLAFIGLGGRGHLPKFTRKQTPAPVDPPG